MQQRIRNEEIQRKREERDRIKKEEEKRRLLRNKEMKERIQERINMQRINSINERRNKSAIIKSQEKEFRKIINIRNQEELLKKHQKKEYTKLQRTIVSQLKFKDQEEKRMNVISITQRNLLYEDETSLKIEADISQMENEEYELIKKLQNTEMLQQSGNIVNEW